MDTERLSMTVLYYLWIAFQLAAGFHLVFPLLLQLLYLLLRKPRTPVAPPAEEPDYAMIVTAYEQTALLPSVVGSLLQLNYSRYLIYVVADNCDISGLSFPEDRVVLLRPETVLASNTRSHFYAIRRFRRPHERLTIIDSDNIVDPEYLNRLNEGFQRGFSAVQGLRKPENLDTMYACLDAARDIYYHYYDGKLLAGVGSSATLAGSGMAFTTALYRECLEHRDITGAGFDKVLQAEVVKRGHRIAWQEDAVVYDKKTARPAQLVAQRARWINTWFRYFRFGFGLMATGLLRLSWNRFLFGLILLRLPLFLLLLLSALCLGVNLIVAPMAAIVWLGALALFVLGFLLALWQSETDRRIYRSLRYIPAFVFYQVLALLKVRKANQYSVATRHDTETDRT
jgi:cellulose synthase/poly-beta-1,6-N-acetylglucosamine synthase-like glycosyltransferase